MKGLESNENLELEVQDFGPVSQAKIELRPMTVFIGPSNTGKSYLAILIYALHKAFNLNFRRSNYNRYYFWSNSSKVSNKKLLQSFKTLATNLQERDTSNNNQNVEVPNTIIDELKYLFEKQESNLGNEILRSFGIKDISDLIRIGSPRCSSLKFCIPNGPDSFEHNFKFNSKKQFLETKTPVHYSLPNNFSNKANFTKSLASILSYSSKIMDNNRHNLFKINELLSELYLYLSPLTLGPLSHPAFYLPADRTGVMHAHRVVVSTLIKGAPMAGLRPDVYTPMLSGVLADFLDELVNIDESYQNPNLSNQAKQIEKYLMSGEIKVSRTELVNYPHFNYHPDGWKSGLSLMNASSMVSELAPVVLYLRHVLEPGNVLIVEEPESHLHPDKQVEFTRQLAELVNNGLRVIITTHSEWVLEELANIVQRSNIKTQNGKSKKDVGVSLSQNQVGAWLFKTKKRPRGSYLEEIKLDEETGLYPSGFDAVSESLYNESVNIFNRIHQQ